MSTTYLHEMSVELQEDIKVLEHIWKDSMKETNSQNHKVIKREFEKRTLPLYIEQAKRKVKMREEYKKASNQFFDSLAQEDFINADKHFKEIVEGKLDLMINAKKAEYLKKMNSTLKNNFYKEI